MRNNQPLQHGKEAWLLIEKIGAKSGLDNARIFHDWIDLMLLCFLSATAKGAGNQAKHEEYERRYLETADMYKEDAPQGKRNIDYFSQAMGVLVDEMTDTEQDVLGEIYTCRITSGERGQFFTPHPITRLMAQMVQPEDGATVSDPTCGSGRMLLEAHRQNPSVSLHGVDIDQRCAKICAINLFLFGCRGIVEWGNSLTMETWARWEIGRVYIFEREIVEPVTTKQTEFTESAEKTEKGDQLGFDL